MREVAVAAAVIGFLSMGVRRRLDNPHGSVEGATDPADGRWCCVIGPIAVR